MKLWYQSMSRTAAWGGYHGFLTQFLQRIKDDGTEIELHGITKVGGIAGQYRYLALASSTSRTAMRMRPCGRTSRRIHGGGTPSG